MARAHKFLSSSVNDVTHISTFMRNLIFILAEVQTKEKPSNRNRTQPEKQNHNEKKKFTKNKIHQKKINLSKSREKQTKHSQVFLNLIYFCSTLYFISRWGVLLSRSITIFRNIKTVLLVVPSSPLIHLRGWYSSRPAREEKSQT